MNTPIGTHSRRRPPWTDARGSALYLVAILGVVVAVTIASVLTYASKTAQLEKRSDLRLESTYAAEYALEKAYQDLHTLVSQNTVNLPTLGQTSGVTNLGTAPTDVLTPAQGYAWTAYLTVPIEDGVPVWAHSNFNATQGIYHFLTVVEFTRNMPSGGAPVRMQFQRDWSYVFTPLFQYALFRDGDMELFPGANFVVNGRVHTNGRLYTGTSASLTFNDYVSEVSGVSNQYAPTDPRAPGGPGDNITYNRGQPMATTREEPPGTTNPRQLIQIPDNTPSGVNPNELLYDEAGLKILVNSTATDTTAPNGIAVRANSRVVATQDGTIVPATDPLALYLTALVSQGSMNDYREGATLTTTDVNVSKVTSSYGAGGLPQAIPNTANWPNNGTVPAALRNQAIPAGLRGKTLWNGIVYVADVTNSSSHRTGVRVTNGANLPDGSNAASPTAGLTIVSENPAYIVGDYNTGGTPPVDSGSNLAANNYAPGYTVQPAAVIADAVTVVSANWISGNYNATASLNARNPANTTINTAIIAGQVDSDYAAYSGGMENFIRLLENWNGRRLTYYGSLINLFSSQQATAHWRYTGDYYNAPTRNWYFDVNFLDPTKLPPGTPVARSLKRGQWAQIR